MPRILIPLRPILGVLQIGIKSQGYREPGAAARMTILKQTTLKQTTMMYHYGHSKLNAKVFIMQDDKSTKNVEAFKYTKCSFISSEYVAEMHKKDYRRKDPASELRARWDTINPNNICSKFTADIEDESDDNLTFDRFFKNTN
ncbi:hypothetical protein Tco_1041049 [Tanacetum coccineum]|uniref:Uncharacterized protein n=1 Tax=Tanacetum coccineum TaxID=301880 RepID=A0ABQ5GFZ2_9ASTR